MVRASQATPWCPHGLAATTKHVPVSSCHVIGSCCFLLPGFSFLPRLLACPHCPTVSFPSLGSQGSLFPRAVRMSTPDLPTYYLSVVSDTAGPFILLEQCFCHAFTGSPLLP